MKPAENYPTPCAQCGVELPEAQFADPKLHAKTCPYRLHKTSRGTLTRSDDGLVFFSGPIKVDR